MFILLSLCPYVSLCVSGFESGKRDKDGVGMVKSSKKITLVIGEMASSYAESIKKELN